MSRIYNYDTLVSAVKSAAEDDSTEFSNYIPTAIGLAEERLARSIDLTGMVSVVNTTCSAGSRFLPKPTGWKLTKDLTVLVSASIRPMNLKTNSFIEDYWPNPTSTSSPLFYADYDADNFLIGPTPDSAYVFTHSFQKKPSPLSTSVSTNYFTDKVPDALFYATMSNMAEFMKHWESVNFWEGKLTNINEGVNNEGRRQRRDDDTDPRNTLSGINTLTGQN